jgi:hypothetical protein
VAHRIEVGQREHLARFDLFSCFPTRWDLSTNEDANVVETIVVNCGRVELS